MAKNMAQPPAAWNIEEQHAITVIQNRFKGKEQEHDTLPETNDKKPNKKKIPGHIIRNSCHVTSL